MTDGGPRHMLGQLEARTRGRRTHLCSACDFPIAVYGRCAPCLHTYCLTCAADMAQCIICGAAITKLERIPAEAGLFISPLTLQGFRSEADLANHARKVWGQLQEIVAAGEGSMAPGMAPGMPGMGLYASTQQQQQQQQQRQQRQQQTRPQGWKPPPPPGAPPSAAAGYGGGRGQQQPGQQRQQAPRQGPGTVMRPR